jgi:hypothetical protein
MAKALKQNDAAQGRPPETGEILEGTSFQINENSVEEGEPISGEPVGPPASPKPTARNQPKLEGASFQVNENSVEEGEPIRQPKG